MAQEEQQEEGLELADTGGGGRKRLVIAIAAVVLLLVVGTGVGLYLGGMLGGGGEEAEVAEEAEEAAGPVKPAIYVDLDPPFTVNLKGESRSRYLQIALQLVTRDPEVEKAIKTHGPAIRNELVLLLGDKTSQELRDRAGKEKLQQQVLRSVQEVLKEATGKEGVENVLFTTFVMQ